MGVLNETNFSSSAVDADLNVSDFRAAADAEYNRRPVFDGIDRWTTPAWYVLGIPGNLFAYSVWIQRRLRHSSGCYLAALALDECIFLFLQVFFELQFKWQFRLLQFPVVCESFPVFFLASQHLSPLLVLGFTVERYISVCHPFKREQYCTTRRAVTVIVGLIFISLVVNSVQAYFWQYDYDLHVCALRKEVQESGSLSFWSIWSWITELLVFGAVPFAILLLNVFVIVETRRLGSVEHLLSRRGNNRHYSTAGGATTLASSSFTSSSSSSSKPSATTVMLLAVSFYLIATTLPVTILYVIFPSFDEGDISISGFAERWNDTTWRRHFTYIELRTVVEEIGMSHYALNFYIYLFTGKIFRRELRRLVMTRVFHGGSRGMVGVRVSTWMNGDDYTGGRTAGGSGSRGVVVGQQGSRRETIAMTETVVDGEKSLARL